MPLSRFAKFSWFVLAYNVAVIVWGGFVRGSGSGGAPLRLRKQGALVWLLAPAFAGMFLLGTSGAVAALGDTLFPARTWAEGVAQDLSIGAHAFIRLRILHPFIAMGTGVCVL